MLHYLLLSILLSTASLGRVYSQSDRPSLPVDKPITFSIGGDEKHRHEVVLKGGDFFQVRVEQLGVDVLLRILNATGVEAARMQLPRSYQKEIILTFVAPAAESYWLEVSATDPKAPPGQITIRREAARAATQHDRRRVEVEHTFAEGMTARDTRNQTEIAIQKFTQARDGFEELADVRMVELTKLLIILQQARAAFHLARSFLNETDAARNRQALEHFDRAARLYHEGGEYYTEAVALMGASVAAEYLKNLPASIEFLKRAIPHLSTPETRVMKTDLLLQIVKHAIVIDDDVTALNHLLLVLPIHKELNLQRETAIVTMTIGAYYLKLGDYSRAEEFLTATLPSRSVLGSKCLEVELLVNLAAVSLALDRKAAAIKLLKEEIPPLVAQPPRCEAQQAVAWNNLGKAYYHLRDYGLAISTYNEALTLTQEKSIKADTYFNLGAAYFESRRYEKALNAYQKAAAFYRDASAQIKVDLSVIQLTKGQSALEQLETGLKLRESTGDKSGTAKTLNRLCQVYLKLGNKQAAIRTSQEALSLYAALSDRTGEAIALANAMQVWSSMGQRRLAIFFGKQSLNRIQELRRASRGIEVSLQQNYLSTFKEYYQQLAQLLIEEGLSEQAVQVLNLYRDQELFDLDPVSNAFTEQIYLSTNEIALARRYEAETNKLRSLQPQIADLKRQLGDRHAETSAESDLQKLEVEFKQSEAVFAAWLRDARRIFSQPVTYTDADRSIKSINALRDALRTLGSVDKQRAVSVYTLSADDAFYVLLIRPEGVEAFSHPTPARAAENRVEDFLTVLRCPGFDPLVEAGKIYDLVFKSVSTSNRQTTLESELDRYKPDLLLWSLGEPLDTLPLAALYDTERKQFLIERYQHAITNRLRPDLISREPKPWLKGIGFGAAREYSGYGPALPGVKKSLTTIFDDSSNGRKGIIDGPALIDDDFRRSDLESLNGRWPLVHIASHFIYHAGDADNSTLLLGDGTKFTLAEMERKQGLFAGVELLVLSACKTSVQQANAYGKVIEGLASLSQRLGANAVIGTLWNVSDLAASEREISFYRLYRDHHDWPKSEVLRQSQLDLLYGRIKVGPEGNHGAQIEGCVMPNARGRRFKIDPEAPLAHPYYWAPFVLYGSSR